MANNCQPLRSSFGFERLDCKTTYVHDRGLCYWFKKRVSSSALCLCQASINLVDVSAHIRDRILEMAYPTQVWRDCQVTPKIPVDKLLSMKGGHWEQRKLLYFKLMWDQWVSSIKNLFLQLLYIKFAHI